MNALVAVDGSDEADRALAYAADVVDAMDGSITVVHAVDPSAYDEGGAEPSVSLWDTDPRLFLESVEAAEQRGLDLLEDATEFADDLGHEVETELLYGNPIATITDYAEVEGVETIFVGHRGRSERAGVMLGSVAKSLVERATVPVTVVR